MTKETHYIRRRSLTTHQREDKRDLLHDKRDLLYPQKQSHHASPALKVSALYREHIPHIEKTFHLYTDAASCRFVTSCAVRACVREYSVKRDLEQCQKRPGTVSKETCSLSSSACCLNVACCSLVLSATSSSVCQKRPSQYQKRPIQCQKRPSTVSKET